MGDNSFTLFELHFHRGFSIGPEKSASEPEETSETGEPASAEAKAEESASGLADVAAKGAVALALLGLLVAIAFAVKKLGGEPPEELEEVDQLAEQF